MASKMLLWVTTWAVVGASPGTAQVELMRLDPRWTVGDADGPMAFGEITDVAVLTGDRIVVLDRAERALWLLDAAGELVSKTGRSGRGPGEFVEPAAMDVSGEQLFVLDQGAGRVSVYAIDNQELRLLDDWALPGLFYDICAVGQQVFVLGAFENHAVHDLSTDGTFIRSFDPVPDANPGDFVAQEEQGFFCSGRLVCDPSSRRLIVAPTMRRTLRAFDLNGRAVWSAALPDFHEAQLVSRGSAYGMAPDPRSRWLGGRPKGTWVLPTRGLDEPHFAARSRLRERHESLLLEEVAEATEEEPDGSAI